jgi:hypothetical protein
LIGPWVWLQHIYFDLKPFSSLQLPDDNHPSIKAIKENKTETDQFIFNPINEEYVNKESIKIGIKKATGKDGISSKILRLSKHLWRNC